MTYSGHSVLQLAVPALESWVVARTRHYDPSFVSADPRFAHAHITALAPFDPDPDHATLEILAEISAGTPAIEVTLSRLARFPDGITHLVPEPLAPLQELTGRLRAAFPAYPPYAGIHGPEVTPHLTLDAVSETVSVASTRDLLGDLVPAVCLVDRLQLAWWEAGACRVMRQWTLGG